MKPYFDDVIEKRKKVDMPTEDEIRFSYKKMLKDIVFIH